jgi:predicted MFS family arabinose efflux permease
LRVRAAAGVKGCDGHRARRAGREGIEQHAMADDERAGVVRAMWAVYVAFIANGFAFANWASRIPQVKAKLHLDPRSLGLVLLVAAIGAVVALPLAGMVVGRFGTTASVAVMSLVSGVGLATVAIGYRYGAGAVAVGLFLSGFGSGLWDVAMNVQGAAVEQRLGRSIMPRFHAGWSVGTVAGALLGSVMVAAKVSVTWHLLGVACATVIVVPLGARGFRHVRAHSDRSPSRSGDHDVVADEPDKPEKQRHPLQAWTEPRTLLIGVFVLCMAFTEGTGNDWLGVAMIDGYHTRAVVGTLAFAAFVAAMTTGRWFGPRLLDRYGRVAMLRSSALLALVGLVLVIYSGVLAVALAAVVLWGLGASLGFPVGMSAASDDPTRAAARVSVVASIGYTAFLAGPPLIGFLGNHVGVRYALTAVAVMLGLAALTADACRAPAAVAEPPAVREPAR